MSFTLLGWSLIIASIAIAATLVFQQGTTKPVLLSRLRSSSSWFGQDSRGPSATLIAPAAVFLIIAGMGTAMSYVVVPQANGSGDAISATKAQAGGDGEILALADYARSIGTDEPAPKTQDGKMLPDVNTMIEKLAARLVTTPDDVQGWKMLGWSYFNTARYQDAADAYAKAIELDPNAADLKTAFEEAKAKASGKSGPDTAAAPLQTGSVGNDPHGAGAGNAAKSEAGAPLQNDARIRSMVDGLAARLESSPRDVEGWTRLMRSRVVLGEKEVATAAFRKALDVFKDDEAASGQIKASAVELGLKAD